MTLRRSSVAALLLAAASANLFAPAWSAEPAATGPAMADRIQVLVPDIESYVARWQAAFDVPGLAIGIVADDRLVYARGFGVRRKGGGLPVDTRTIFQIGSTTKAFLATSLAILIDRGKLRWEDRIVDLYPGFLLKDPWVTREFRVFDLLAQRSGLPPLVNDVLAMLDFDRAALIGSLRHVEAASSFRATFAYTNLTHLLASRIVARAADAPDWNALLRRDLFDPLEMKDSTCTPQGIEAADNHAKGHRWSPEGTAEVPFTSIFPYQLEGAGCINSNVDDMARWVRLQLGHGAFEGRRIVSPKNLAVTRMSRVALSDALSYAMGWYIHQTPNGSIVWHDGDALSFSSFVGLAPDRNIGVVILTNETHVGFPVAIGGWVLDRILGNPNVDYAAGKLTEANVRFASAAKRFARPANPRPSAPLARLAGRFVEPSFGETEVKQDGETLVMEIRATGAALKLEPWDGAVFRAELMPTGQFGPIVDLGYMTRGFVEFQMDGDGKPNVLSLSLAEGQQFAFRRQ